VTATVDELVVVGESPPTWRTDRRLRDLVLGFLALKVGFVIVAYLAGHLLPLDAALIQANGVYPISGVPDWFRAFATWDTGNYLSLAEKGYGQGPGTDTFFPLYPFLIYELKPLFLGSTLVSAWVIANAVSLLVPVYMYKLGCLFWSREKAFRSVVLLLAFPMAFFLSTAYSESLFLALVLMAFYFLFTERVYAAAACCLLVPLTRPPGLMFAVPVLVVALQAAFAKGVDRPEAVRHAVRTYWLPLLAAVAGVLVYLGFSAHSIGSPLGGLQAQSYYINGNSLGNVLKPIAWFQDNFINADLVMSGYINGWPERIAFLVFLPVLVGVVVTQNKAFATFAVLYFLVPAMSGHLMSYTRFVLVVFPLFFFLGTRKRWVIYLAAPMFCVQLMYYIMHVNAYWVA
jgi:hypothetical protein